MIRFSPSHIINRAGSQPAGLVVKRQQPVTGLNLLNGSDRPVEHPNGCTFCEAPVVPYYRDQVSLDLDVQALVLAVVLQRDSPEDHSSPPVFSGVTFTSLTA